MFADTQNSLTMQWELLVPKRYDVLGYTVVTDNIIRPSVTASKKILLKIIKIGEGKLILLISRAFIIDSYASFFV